MRIEASSSTAGGEALARGPADHVGPRPSWLTATELQILLAVALLALVFSFAFPDSFATEGTLFNMTRVASILLVVSVGQAFALIVGGFDISVGANMGLVSVASALAMKNGAGVGEGVAIGVLIGAAVGLVNGFGVAVLRITPFVMTLGMLTSVRGLADQLANGGVITGLPRGLAMFGRASWGAIPSAAVIAAVVFVVAWAILQGARAGLYLFAIGGGRETARLAGVAVSFYEGLAYTICGAAAGVGGVMLTSRVGVAQGSLGGGYELLSVATAVIGGVAIGGGVGRLTGVVLGVALITVLDTGLDIAGVNPFLQQIATGLVLILAVLLSNARGVSFRKWARNLVLPRAG